jgi:hypothetical protein
LVPLHYGPNIYKDTKCLLYWCFLEFIDWRYTVSHVGIFDPLTYSLVHLSPSPPKFKSTCIHTVCNRRDGIGGLRQINTCRQVPLLVNFFEKPIFRFGVFIVSPCSALTIIGWSYRQGKKNFNFFFSCWPSVYSKQ